MDFKEIKFVVVFYFYFDYVGCLELFINVIVIVYEDELNGIF